NCFPSKCRYLSATCNHNHKRGQSEDRISPQVAGALLLPCLWSSCQRPLQPNRKKQNLLKDITTKVQSLANPPRPNTARHLPTPLEPTSCLLYPSMTRHCHVSTSIRTPEVLYLAPPCLREPTHNQLKTISLVK
ncbi:unnamed protein product, partial [Musa acuminata subsp. burmannicoides]